MANIEERGRQASVDGFAREHIAAGDFDEAVPKRFVS